MMSWSKLSYHQAEKNKTDPTAIVVGICFYKHFGQEGE